MLQRIEYKFDCAQMSCVVLSAELSHCCLGLSREAADQCSHLLDRKLVSARADRLLPSLFAFNQALSDQEFDEIFEGRPEPAPTDGQVQILQRPFSIRV